MQFPGGPMLPPPNFPPNFMPNVGPLPPPQMPQQQQNMDCPPNVPPQILEPAPSRSESTSDDGPTYDIGEMLRKIKATVQAEDEPGTVSACSTIELASTHICQDPCCTLITFPHSADNATL